MNDMQSLTAGRDDTSGMDVLPNGAAAAAILSAGIGCCALGILAVVGDGSAVVARWLTFYMPTGPLSGVTTTAIIVWLVSWLILARRWRSKTVAIVKVNAVAFALMGVALLLTFPPFADLLLGK
ncbi:MAG TPA: hypothetical protein VJW77_01040 [Terriglobia bacterium]|nr:hypothetical protein [Terriglobia bacterium]HKT10387.1 hypothetical protein [Terriglobia bacterium]